jgi:hypothetical protein
LNNISFDEEAEYLCEASIVSALQYFPDSLDANQALASLRLSQNRGPEACVIMKSVFEKVMAVRRQINSRPIIEDIKSRMDDSEPVEGL